MNTGFPRLTLRVRPGRFAVARLSAEARVPEWATAKANGFQSVTWTATELSIVCASDRVPLDIQAERDWRLLEVESPLPFEMTGVLASIAVPLAEDGVNLFVISTFETDFILVPDRLLDRAITSLLRAGHDMQHA